MDNRPLLGRIKVPVLIIAGDHDVSTPWTGHGDVLAQQIEGARVVRLPATHLSSVERPSSFTAALFDFLLQAPAADPIEAGMAMRRSVLGDDYVDRATAPSGFNREFQEMITRYAWGTIWTRPGLDPRVRRLLALTATVSLGRWEEFRLHARTGLAAELESVDLKELLLQIAVYAGVPAANTGFQIAAEEMSRLGKSLITESADSEPRPQGAVYIYFNRLDNCWDRRSGMSRSSWPRRSWMRNSMLNS
jgi:3-oxoadipate enol-lactonase/4-carboxymuconolactone decarboxylase